MKIYEVDVFFLLFSHRCSVSFVSASHVDPGKCVGFSSISLYCCRLLVTIFAQEEEVPIRHPALSSHLAWVVFSSWGDSCQSAKPQACLTISPAV